jgi:hypothetical protein
LLLQAAKKTKKPAAVPPVPVVDEEADGKDTESVEEEVFESRKKSRVPEVKSKKKPAAAPPVPVLDKEADGKDGQAVEEEAVASLRQKSRVPDVQTTTKPVAPPVPVVDAEANTAPSPRPGFKTESEKRKAKAWRTHQNKVNKEDAIAQAHLEVQAPRGYHEVKGMLGDLESFFDCAGGKVLSLAVSFDLLACRWLPQQGVGSSARR